MKLLSTSLLQCLIIVGALLASSVQKVPQNPQRDRISQVIQDGRANVTRMAIGAAILFWFAVPL